MEDSSTVGWVRVGATIMLLPDLPVGGVRALKEIGQTAAEASEALAKSAQADSLTAKASRDLKNVTNPNRHPAEMTRQLDRVRRYQAEATAQTKLVNEANAKIRMVFARDIALFPTATAAGAGLMASAPPDILLTPAQKEQDEALTKSITPAKGWPKDVKVEIRVIGYSNQKKN